MRLQSEAMRR